MNDERQWTLLEVDLAVKGSSPDAGTAVEWFWRNGPFLERYTDFIVRAREWCDQPALRALIERLRPPPPVREGDVFPHLMDWLALSSAIGRKAEVLGWFDQRVAAGDLPLPPMNRLRRLILERGMLRDWLAFGEPYQGALWRLRSSAEQTRELAEAAPGLIDRRNEEAELEVALLYRVAQLTRPHQLLDLDAAIEAPERAAGIRAWLARPEEELTQALISRSLD